MTYIVERELYAAPRIVRTEIKTLEDWTKVASFESSTGRTPEFAAFAAMFRARVKKLCAGAGLVLQAFNIGHFYVSGFVKNPETGK